jgi:hypothetical protein
MANQANNDLWGDIWPFFNKYFEKGILSQSLFLGKNLPQN